MSIEKIAVLRANALGDFIFATPALYALREKYPNAEIIYLGKPWHKEFLHGRPSPINKVIAIPPYPGVGEKQNFTPNNKQLNEFFQNMQREKFDVAVQIHGGGRNSNPFLTKLGAKLTVGLRDKDAPSLDINIPYIYYHNEVLRYLEVVSKLGATVCKIEPKIHVTTNDLKEFEKVINRIPKERIAVVHPGATDIKRRWPAKKFAQVADSLANKGIQVITTGTEAEKDVVKKMLNNMNTEAINLCGKLNVSGLTGLLYISSLVISNDTGPRNLAEAVNTATIGIYWCGNLINAGPPTRTYHRPFLSWTIYCPLCGANCTKDDFKDKICNHHTSFVNTITTEEVIQAADELLDVDKPNLF